MVDDPKTEKPAVSDFDWEEYQKKQAQLTGGKAAEEPAGPLDIEKVIDSYSQLGIIPNPDSIKQLVKDMKDTNALLLDGKIDLSKVTLPIIKIQLTAQNKKRLFEETGEKLDIFTMVDYGGHFHNTMKTMTSKMIEDFIVAYFKGLKKGLDTAREMMSRFFKEQKK